ncbi:MAG: hypothetical protein PHS35_03290 [Dehalococcoidales bacterium]|nr:hypothetical protein [Dehalococcoidales bacterium]
MSSFVGRQLDEGSSPVCSVILDEHASAKKNLPRNSARCNIRSVSV